MSDDRRQNNHLISTKKGFLSLILSHFFHGEPKNRDQLVELIRDSEQHHLIDHETRQMLEGVMDISEQRVRDIMIPRSHMVTLALDQTLDECLNVITRSSHSRFPVLSQDRGKVEGIMLAKDLLPFLHTDSAPFSVKKILRSAVIVPESKRLDKLLKDFRSQRYHMAVIVDEFGTLSGLVTIEDILELIVGDIEDEYDSKQTRDIKQLSKHVFSIRGLTDIEDFNYAFSTSFSDQEVDTMGGLVMQAFGHLPGRGESITLNGYVFKVTMADSRRVIKLNVKTPNNAPEPKLAE